MNLTTTTSVLDQAAAHLAAVAELLEVQDTSEQIFSPRVPGCHSPRVVSTTTVGDLLARGHHLSADLSSSGQASTNQQWRPFDLATYPASWEFSAPPRIVPPAAGSHVDAETRDWAVMAPSTSNTMARATDSAYDVAKTKHLDEYVGDLLTSAEVAQIIRVPHATLRYWRHIGVGPKSFKMGPRRVLYREDDVLAWVAAQYAAQA